MNTGPLTGAQWLACIGLAALLPLVVEVGKVVRGRRRATPPAPGPVAVVAPARAHTDLSASGALTPRR